MAARKKKSELTGSERLTKLSPRHLAAIRLRIEGRDNAFIAEQLGVSNRTLHLWFSDPMIKEEMKRQLDAVHERFAESMANAAFRGINALVGMIEKPAATPDISDSMRLEAVRELLDRHAETARIADKVGAGSGGGAGQVNFFQLFAKMPDDALAEYLHRWQNGGDGEIIEGNGRVTDPPA